MKKIVIALLFATNSYALETDQYVMWDYIIKDSTAGVNNYFNRHIEKGINTLNSTKNSANFSCDKASEIIVKEFLRNNTLTEDQIEIELKDNSEIELYPDPHNRRLLRDSTIFQEFTSLFSKDQIFPVAPNIRVNGIDVGTDKLGHFISLGLNYYHTYKKSMDLHHDISRAFNEAIEYGIFTEKTYYGYLTSGVFSYADLESNFQGLIFILNICSTNGYIKFDLDSGRWMQQRSFDITPYVNPNWNEVHNPSHFSDKPWKKVTKVLTEKKYCEKLSSLKVSSILDDLNSRDQASYSKKYLDQKIVAGELNDNSVHSIQSFCAAHF